MPPHSPVLGQFFSILAVWIFRVGMSAKTVKNNSMTYSTVKFIYLIYLICAYSRVSNNCKGKITYFVPKMDNTHIPSSELQSSSPHSNLKNNYVLNCSTFYHYWLEDEPSYWLPARFLLIAISSKFLEKLGKVIVSKHLVFS